jgi:hypothetical protein
MDASYHHYLKATDDMKKWIAEGIFWLAESIEQDIRQKDYPLRDKCISEILDIKAVAEQSLKDPAHWIGTERFSFLVNAVLMDVPKE